MLTKVLLLLSVFAGVSQAQVTDCAAGKSVFTINSQDFTPNPPVAGENATLWIDYTVPEGIDVTSGTAKYSINLNGIPFAPTVDDLCTQITCPQTPGTYNVTSVSLWNGGVSGKIVSKIQWFDSTGKELLCSQTTIRTKFFREELRSDFRTFLRHRQHRIQDQLYSFGDFRSSSSSSNDSRDSSSGSSTSTRSDSSSSSRSLSLIPPRTSANEGNPGLATTIS